MRLQSVLGSGIIKNLKETLWFGSKTSSKGLHPALSTTCSVVWIFVKAATLHKGSVVKPGITDNSIRSLSFRATHHIFCVEFFRWGWGFIQYHGQLGGPRAGEGWNLGYRKFPVKQLILVLDSTSGPTSMETHFLWWVRTHQWSLVRVTLSLGHFRKSRSTSHLSGSPQLP